MKSFFFKLFLLIIVLILNNADLLAQYTWTKYPGNPVFPGGPGGSWYKGLFTPCVLFNADSTRFEMWFAASTNAGGGRPWQIGFTKSNDGVVWTVPEIVLSPRAGNWDNYSLQSPFVIRENGQYKMWYTSEGPSYSNIKIGYATSPDGVNWNRLDNPIFEAGTQPWEAGGVGACCVMPIVGGFKMWYVGATTAGVNGKQCLGYATSTDGISWQRDTLHNPVLEPGATGKWDDYWLMSPRVLLIDDLYYMWYGAAGGYFADFRVGLATSIDGINWDKYSSNPVLSPSPSGWDNGEVETGCVVQMGDTLYMWYDGSNSGTYHWQIGLATSPYVPNALPPGTYTIGTGGNFATIQDAFNKLQTDGISGAVTFELIDELYTAPTDSFGFNLNGPIPGAGPNSRVTIKPAENKNVVIEGAGHQILKFRNTSYVTLDGVGITGPRTLTIHGLHGTQYDWKVGVYLENNCDHSIIKDLIFIHEDIDYETIGIAAWTPSGSETADSNIFQNNFIKRAGIGIAVGGKDQYTRASDINISNNKIGSENDSLITLAIHSWALKNSIIEKNVVQNLRQQFGVFDMVLNPAVNMAFSSNSIIRDNVIHNVKTNSLQGSTGIWVSGDFYNGYGSDNLVYNNMVFDIQSTSAQFDSRVSGIQLWYQKNPKVYFNSVYLSGTGTNKYGSAALYITSNVTNADIKNNILVNTRDESPYCASAICDYSSATFTSDYNDLFYDDTNNNNCLVRISSTNYYTLADWQAQGKDLHSYVEMPHFIDPYLHIDETIETYLESRGTPITGIIDDFDNDSRNTLTPDIGADEFDGIAIVGIDDEETLPTEYALHQNYPNPFNPSTNIQYAVSNRQFVTLKVYDVLGNEIETLINEEKPIGTYEITWYAEQLPSGVYFCQLRAGNFIETKKMLLVK